MSARRRPHAAAAVRDDSLLERDELAAELAQSVREQRQQVSDAHRRLTELSHQLAHAERQLADRLKLLRHRADAAFDWLQSCPWDARLRHAMSNVFCITSFRPLQREALNGTLMKRDVFAILPTGAGKSLIYQLAAVVDGGLTLVVSPLISLSMDQKAALKKRSIVADCLHSELSKNKQKAIYDSFLPSHAFNKTSEHPRVNKADGVQWTPDDVCAMVLFVTPEQAVRSKRLLSRLEKLHEKGHLSRICIDEAHCCSSWGHDFRPEYRKLGILRRQCPSTPIIALSATCDSRTVEDVSSVLEMQHAVVFRSGVNRPNLFYEVRHKQDTDAAVVTDIAHWIKTEFQRQCGIIYVLSRKDAEKYAAGLEEHGIDAACYHADLDISVRTKVHNQWSNGQLDIVVATIAFGLGIDHPHVRFIIHATMASSLEAYYQESGRAGRDGRPAKCIVLHKPRDFARMSAFVGDKGSARLQKMYEMYKYACSRGLGSGSLCRRELILNSFGEKMPQRSEMQRNRCCDLCDERLGIMSPGLKSFDVTDLAKDIYEMIHEFVLLYPGKKTTILQFANDWGKSTKGSRKRAKRGEKAAVGDINVNTRVAIINELVLNGALQEIHRHSSYAVNAYVTIGNEDVMLNLDRIEVALLKKNEVPASLAGVRVRRTEESEAKTELSHGHDPEIIEIEDSEEEPQNRDHTRKEEHAVVGHLETTGKTEILKHEDSVMIDNETKPNPNGELRCAVAEKELDSPPKKKRKGPLV
ncbi:DNA helicase [Gracilaria domingensis]|nr:DNA helicase [Gracilaria domingensis]